MCVPRRVSSGFYEHSRRRYFVFKFLSGDAAAGSERPVDDCEWLSFDKRVALPRRHGTGYSIDAGLWLTGIFPHLRRKVSRYTLALNKRWSRHAGYQSHTSSSRHRRCRAGEAWRVVRSRSIPVIGCATQDGRCSCAGALSGAQTASKRIGELIAEGKSVNDAKAEVDNVLLRLGDELEAATAEADAVQSELDALLLETPNLPDERVPHGVSEDDNVEVFRWGEPKALEFAARDHVDLGEALAQMDMDAASRIAGSRFSLLSDQLATASGPGAVHVGSTHGATWLS